MKRIVLIITAFFGFSLFFSCTHDPVLPDQQVSYANDIYPIILSGCNHSGCHDTLASNETSPLISYDDVVHYVTPGKPKSSKIYTSVTGTGEEFMPKAPYPALNDRQIKLLYIWIAQGAKNN
ncbi:hypothetical protein BH09BAC5_BH09BAC5_18270 [soil metagenome]